MTSQSRSSGDLSVLSQRDYYVFNQGKIKQVKAYSAVLQGSDLYVVYSLAGLSGLNINRYLFSETGGATDSVREVRVFFDRMDEFDQMQCRGVGSTGEAGDGLSLECIFAGRSVTKVAIRVDEAADTATAMVSGESGQKRGYKNWMCEGLVRVGEVVLVEGRRLEVQAETETDSTFDWSGVLAYDFGTRSSEWMVAGLSKDELFRVVGANKYRV